LFGEQRHPAEPLLHVVGSETQAQVHVAATRAAVGPQGLKGIAAGADADAGFQAPAAPVVDRGGLFRRHRDIAATIDHDIVG
jgi:hypothetical protein